MLLNMKVLGVVYCEVKRVGWHYLYIMGISVAQGVGMGLMSELLCIKIYGIWLVVFICSSGLGCLCVCLCNLSQAVTHWGGGQ